MSRLRVLVADDHQAMLDKLVRLLSPDFDVVASVRDGAAAVREAPLVNPDILVLDIAMPLGSVGFVVKNRLVSDLVPAILSVLAGQSFVSPSVRRPRE
jgi:DNA-binding NarL/FixJ family response regulator